MPEDRGRIVAIDQTVVAHPFNCLGPYSDAGPADCAELRNMDREGDDLERAHKPPSLRGVTARATYMHAGQFATLAAVVRHYNTAPSRRHTELKPRAISETEPASELPEVLGLSDRIAVMTEGRVVRILTRAEATPEIVMGLASHADR